MASCPSPPKKRPKLSLKFIRKDKQPIKDEDSEESYSQRSSNARTALSVPNGQSNAGSSTTPDSVTTTTCNKDNQLEVVRSLPPPFAGLQNLGNTCYLNSVLQALRFCPGFCQGLCQLTSVWEQMRKEFSAEKGEGDNEMRECGREMQFVMNLKKLYDKMTAKEEEYMANPSMDTLISPSPDEVLETIRELNPMFQGFLQHDSQELLCCLLSYLLDACQKLKKQLIKLYPPSLSNKQSPCLETVDGQRTKSESGTSRVSEGGSETEASKLTSPVGYGTPVNVSGSDRKDDAVNANGDCTPNMKNSKKRQRRLSCTPSNDSVIGGKSKTPSSSGKTNGNVMNGFDDHSRVAGADEKKQSGKENCAGVINGNETTLSNGKHETSAKKKRLGKFRVPTNQSTLLSTFAPLKKEIAPLNGIRTDLPENMNGIDCDLQSVKRTNNEKESTEQGTTTASTDKTNSSDEIRIKSSPGVNSKGDSACVKNVVAADSKPVSSMSDPKKVTIEEQLCLIQGLFQGALVLRTRCNECESYTERREEFQDISLPVRGLPRSTRDEEDEGVPVSPGDLSLSWAISEFACVERLTDDNKYFCEHCRHHAEAERSMLFGELPPVLTIHLKRFSAFAGFLSADSTVSKINDHLATPLSLCLSQWCAKQYKQLHCKYDLCAVVMHSGVSSSSGHYISYVQIPDRPWPSGVDAGDLSECSEPQWGKFDDEKVSVLTQQELASSVLHPVSSSSSAATPYLLFYRQVLEID